MAFGSKATETEGAGKALLAIAENFPEIEVEPAVRPAMGRPSINGLPLHNHNILLQRLPSEHSAHLLHRTKNAPQTADFSAFAATMGSLLGTFPHSLFLFSIISLLPNLVGFLNVLLHQ